MARTFDRALAIIAILSVALLASVAQAALRTPRGETLKVQVKETGPPPTTETQSANLSEGGVVNITQPASPRIAAKGGADPNCATNSGPGFGPDYIKWGSIITVSGIYEKLGQQTARVMKVASEQWANSITKIPGPYPTTWGCSLRPGIFGRKISLSIFTLPSRTPEDANSAMHSLIDNVGVFLVRDCYLQSDVMGAATTYQNQKGMPGVFCSFSEMPTPALARWNFSPSTDPLKIAALYVGYLLNKADPAKGLLGLGKQRLGIIADPTTKDNTTRVALQVAEFLKKPVPEACIVYKSAGESQNGMDAEIQKLRGCYGNGQDPDAMYVSDAANAAFGALAAQKAGWRPKDAGVAWACETCWVIVLAEICGNACEDMITDCQALPCIPWSDFNKYPASKALEDTRKQYLGGQPIDILTYGPEAITGGLLLWLAETGPNLSREAFRRRLEGLNNWDAGIGPILNTNPRDHYGGKSVWLIQFCGSQACDPQGKAPWFKDLTNRFVPIAEVGVPDSVAS